MVQKDTFFFTEKENTRFATCIYSLYSGSSWLQGCLYF